MFVNLLPDGLCGVQWTLLIPLLSRARITRKYKTLLDDPKAIEIVELLSGPLSDVDNVKELYNDLGNAARARALDDAVRSFMLDHPQATIVNLGCGLDTAFSRIDNGQVAWFDVDLPAVIEMRKLILPETGRSRCIACSILDSAWMREINPREGGLLMIAGGVLPYFSDQEVKSLVLSLADNFPSREFVFDAVSEGGGIDSRQVIERVGISSASMKWALGRHNDLNEWDRRIVVQNHYPLFAHIKRSPDLDAGIIRIMDECDKLWKMSIVHMRFAA